MRRADGRRHPLAADCIPHLLDRRGSAADIDKFLLPLGFSEFVAAWGCARFAPQTGGGPEPFTL